MNRPHSKTAAGCATAPSTKRLPTFAEIVGDYRSEYQETNQAERDWFASMDWKTALEKAAMCRWRPDKDSFREVRHPHQRRTKVEVLEQAYANLQKANLRTAKRFEELHDRIEAAIGGIRGIADLTIYDIAFRIGSNLGLEPEKVYLHAGVRKGAAALGLGRGKKTLAVAELPPVFRTLRPTEIEDCLCIYKDQLKDMQFAARPNRT